MKHQPSPTFGLYCYLIETVKRRYTQRIGVIILMLLMTMIPSNTLAVDNTAKTSSTQAMLGSIPASIPLLASFSNTPLPQYPILNGTVYSIAPDGSGGVFIGGSFTTLTQSAACGGATVARSYLAHILSTGCVDLVWNITADGGLSAFVANGGTLYVGGDFFTINGQTHVTLAALDIATGSPFFFWNQNPDPVTGGGVVALEMSGNTIYAGGSFSVIGGQLRNYLASIDATTGDATSWNPNANYVVNNMAINGNVIYIGGGFTTISGQPRNRLAAVDATTGDILAWDPNVNENVSALALSGNTIYVGGSFTSIGGQVRNRLAAVDATTGGVTSWDPNANDYVSALEVSDNTIYVGGAFTSIEGQARNYLAAVDAASGAVTTWNPNLNSGVSAMAVSGNTLFVGGYFTTIGGQAHQGFAAFGPPILPTAPSSLGATVVSTSQTDLSWADNSTDETGFKIERATTPSGPWTLIATTAPNTTNYSDSGLICNTTYYYRIWATNNEGDSANITTNAMSVCPTPNMPSSLAATAFSTTQIDLTWVDNSSDETGFKVERASNFGGPWTLITTTTADVTSYSDTGLACGTTYYYQVRATYNGSDSANVGTNTMTLTCPGAPLAPSGLTAIGTSMTQVDLSWTDNSSDETGFKIERSTNPSGPWVLVTSTAIDVTNYSDTGLSCNVVYYYQVKATNASGDSTPITANAVTQLCPQPANPTGLNIVVVSESQIDLSWTDNSSDETGFKIERAINPGGPWTAVITTASNIQNYSDTGLMSNQIYYYQVRATNNGTDSANITANATTLPPTVAIADASLAENGGSMVFVVSLSAASGVDVSMNYAISNDTALAGSDYTNTTGLLFISAGQAQGTISVPIINDAVDESDEIFGVTLSGLTNGSSFTDAEGQGTIADDDTAGVNHTAVMVNEDGATSGSYNLTLQSQPTSLVQINMTTDAQCNITSGNPTIFSAGDWNNPKPVTVQAIDDFTTETSPHNCVVTHVFASSTDTTYQALGDVVKNVAVLDNDSPGFNFNATTLNVGENEATTSFTIRLNTQPTGGNDVTLPLSTSNVGDCTVFPTSITISNADWEASHLIFVTGSNNDLDDSGNQRSCTVITGDPVSGDSAYDGAAANPTDITVSVLDDDAAGLVVSAMSGHTVEDGTTANFTLRLASQPVSSVTLVLTSSNLAEGTVNNPSLMFDATNWNVDQAVTVKGEDDVVQDGAQSYMVTGDAGSSDPNYNNLSISVLGINDDNDTPPNQNPHGLVDSYSVNQDKTLTIGAPGVLANDYDPENQALSVLPITFPQHGSLTLWPDGSFTFVPTPGFSGSDYFIYLLKDGQGGLASVTVGLTVVPAPTATATPTVTPSPTPTMTPPPPPGSTATVVSPPLGSTATVVSTPPPGSTATVVSTPPPGSTATVVSTPPPGSTATVVSTPPPGSTATVVSTPPPGSTVTPIGGVTPLPTWVATIAPTSPPPSLLTYEGDWTEFYSTCSNNHPLPCNEVGPPTAEKGYNKEYQGFNVTQVKPPRVAGSPVLEVWLATLGAWAKLDLPNLTLSRGGVTTRTTVAHINVPRFVNKTDNNYEDDDYCRELHEDSYDLHALVFHRNDSSDPGVVFPNTNSSPWLRRVIQRSEVAIDDWSHRSKGLKYQEKYTFATYSVNVPQDGYYYIFAKSWIEHIGNVLFSGSVQAIVDYQPDKGTSLSSYALNKPTGLIYLPAGAHTISVVGSRNCFNNAGCYGDVIAHYDGMLMMYAFPDWNKAGKTCREILHPTPPPTNIGGACPLTGVRLECIGGVDLSITGHSGSIIDCNKLSASRNITVPVTNKISDLLSNDEVGFFLGGQRTVRAIFDPIVLTETGQALFDFNSLPPSIGESVLIRTIDTGGNRVWQKVTNKTIASPTDLSGNWRQINLGLTQTTRIDAMSWSSSGEALDYFSICASDPNPPILQVKPTSLKFSATLTDVKAGKNPPPQFFAVSNEGQGQLDWSATANAAWLKLEPTSGTALSSVKTSVDVSGLITGTYTDTITVMGNGPQVQGSPKTVEVSLAIGAAPPPPDPKAPVIKVTVTPCQDAIYFVRESDVFLTYEVTVDWKGEPGKVNFTLNDKTISTSPAGNTAAHTYNMGQDLLYDIGAKPNYLMIQAIAPDGTPSNIYEFSPYGVIVPSWFQTKATATGCVKGSVSLPLLKFTLGLAFPKEPFSGELTPPNWVYPIGGQTFGVKKTQAEFKAEIEAPSGKFQASLKGQTGFKAFEQEIIGSVTGAGKGQLGLDQPIAFKEVSLKFGLSGSLKSKEKSVLVVLCALPAPPGPPACTAINSLLSIKVPSFPIVEQKIHQLTEAAYFQATLKPSISVAFVFETRPDGWKWKDPNASGGLELKGALISKINVSAVDLAFEAYMSIGGKVDLQASDNSNASYLKGSSLEGELGVEVKASVYIFRTSNSASRQFNASAKMTWEYVQGRTLPLTVPSQATQPQTTLTWDIMPRNHVTENYGFFQPYPVNETETLIARDLFPQAHPVIAAGANTALLLWEHDDSLKPLTQGQEINYSVYDGSSWNYPNAITNDPFQDFNPQIAADNQGHMVAVWERNKNLQPLTATLDMTYTNGFEIAYAVWNGTNWSEPEYLTDNEVFDHAPTLIKGNDGQLLLIWRQNPRGELWGYPGAPDTMFYTLWNGTAWSTPQVLLNNVDNILSLTGARYDANTMTLIYSQDQDKDLSTPNDQELYAMSWQNQAWQAPVALTQDSSSDDRPTMFYDSQGQPRLFWLKDRQLYALMGNLTGQPRQIKTEKGMWDYTAAQDSQGNVVLVWQGNSDAGSDVFYSFYQHAQDKFSLPRPLTEDEAVESFMQPTFDSAGEMLMSYRRTQFVVQTQTVSDVNVPTVEQTDLVVMRHNFEPNLDVISGSLSAKPTNPLPGSSVKLQVVVQNSGDKEVAAPHVSFYLGNPFFSGAQLIGEATSQVSLMGGMTSTLSIDWQVPTTGGPFALYAVVAPSDQEAQFSPVNVASTLIILPDLTVNGVAVQYITADVVTLTAVIGNQGLAAAQQYGVAFRLDDPLTGTVLASILKTDLPPGGETLAQVVVDTSRVPTGPHVVYALVDPYDDLVESDETNNDDWGSLDALPDVRLSSSAVTIQKGALGNWLINIWVFNDGARDANEVPLGLYSAIPQVGMSTVASTTVSIPAGQYMMVTLNVPPQAVLYAGIGISEEFQDRNVSNNIIRLQAANQPHNTYLPIITK